MKDRRLRTGQKEKKSLVRRRESKDRETCRRKKKHASRQKEVRRQERERG